MKKVLIIVLLLITVGLGVYLLVDSREEMEADNADTQQDIEEDTTEDTQETEENTYMDISPEEAKELIEDTEALVILDVSSAYDQGHIPGAINYYVGDGSLDDAIPTLNMDVPYLVYCHVDSASISGAEKLIEAGFEDVYRLEGNYSAWVDAGYEVEE